MKLYEEAGLPPGVINFVPGRGATVGDPAMFQIVAPNEPIVLLSFEALMGEYSGMINVCIPFKVIEPIMPEFSQSNWFSSSKPRTGVSGREQILNNIFNSGIEISAVLAETPLNLNDIMTLGEGDVIDTGVRADSPVSLLIQGRKKFRGVPGMMNGKKMVRIENEVLPSDPDADTEEG